MDDKQPLIYGQPSAPPPYTEQPPPYGPGYPPQPYLPPQQGYPAPPPPLSGYGAAPPMPQGGYCGAPPPMPQGGCCGQTGMYHGQQVTVIRGQPVASHQVIIAMKPSNYVITSVITMIFCCFAFGLIGLLYGLQVDSAWASGDREGARRMSVSARGWNLAGMVVGIFIIIAVIIAVAVSASK